MIFYYYFPFFYFENFSALTPNLFTNSAFNQLGKLSIYEFHSDYPKHCLYDNISPQNIFSKSTGASLNSTNASQKYGKLSAMPSGLKLTIQQSPLKACDFSSLELKYLSATHQGLIMIGRYPEAIFGSIEPNLPRVKEMVFAK